MSNRPTNRKEKKPPEASYILLARELTKIKLALKQTTHAKKQVERLVASAMHAVGVSSFRFKVTDDGPTYQAKLNRPTVQTVDMQRFYALVRTEQISLDEFLRCCSADESEVLALFGKDTLDLISTYDKGPLQLTIGEVSHD